MALALGRRGRVRFRPTGQFGTLLSLMLLVLVPTSTALGWTYPDPVGDVPGEGPDIEAVSISHTFGGKVTFGVTFANRTQLLPYDTFAIAIDSDQNQLTGFRGRDYWLSVDARTPPTAVVRRHVQGSSPPTSDEIGSTPVVWTNRTATITVEKALFANTTRGLSFAVSCMGMQGLVDEAPLSGMIAHSLDVSIARIQLPRPVRFVRGGTAFSVRGATVKLSTDEVFNPDTLTATATIGGRTVRPRGGSLTWTIPRSARGKRLVVTISASYSTLQRTQRLTLPIR